MQHRTGSISGQLHLKKVQFEAHKFEQDKVEGNMAWQGFWALDS